MFQNSSVKEQIIAVTTALIKESGGDPQSITTRAIAEKANVGVGLINYHFQTKDNLIEICIQRMIGGLFAAYDPQDTEIEPLERLKQTAKIVFDFFLNNPAVSKISILGDLTHPSESDNTAMGCLGFVHGMEGLAIDQEEKQLAAFVLTAVLQMALLRKSTLFGLSNLDLENKTDRDTFVDRLVTSLLGEKTYEKREEKV